MAKTNYSPTFPTYPGNAGAITVSDTNNLEAPCVIYVGAAGNVKVTTAQGTDVTFVGAQAGQVIPVQVIRVWSTGTTVPTPNTNLFGISSGFSFSQSAAWTPAQLPGLALWLDAADASTITLNGSTVSQWNDKSGNNRHASQATAANQPTRTLNGLGGRTVLTFDGVNDFLNATFTLTNFSVGIVGTLTANTATIYYPLGFGNPPSGSAGLSVGGTNFTQKAALNSPSLLTNETVTLNSPYLITAHSQTGNRLISFNGQTPATDTNSQSISEVRIGQRSDGVWPYAGPIGEIVITNTALSNANRQLLEGYLAWKWSGLI